MVSKTYSLRKVLVKQLTGLGDNVSMGFTSDAEAVHWAIRQGIEKLEILKMNRQNLGELESTTPAEDSLIGGKDSLIGTAQTEKVAGGSWKWEPQNIRFLTMILSSQLKRNEVSWTW